MSDGQYQIAEPLYQSEFEQVGLSTKRKATMTGVEKIAMKRLQQKVRYGHTIKKDYETYPDFELIDAAKAILDANPAKFPETWDKEAAKRLCAKELEDRLAIAGALLAAQIDILNYTE